MVIPQEKGAFCRRSAVVVGSIPEREPHAARHRHAGEEADRSRGKPEELELLEPLGRLHGHFADGGAPEVEGAEVLERLELQQPLVGDGSTGEIEQGEVLERLGAESQQDGEHVVRRRAAEPQGNEPVGDVAAAEEPKTE